METERFRELARELAKDAAPLREGLGRAREAAELLRARAAAAVRAFREAASAEGAEHLTHVEVGEVEPDAKHVDCVSFTVSRGRWELVCVSKAEGALTLVGPFRRGKSETPCADFAPRGPEVERGLEERLLALLRAASTS